MSHNSKSNHFSCSEVAILILVSRAGTTGIGGAAGAAAPPIPVPARLTGIKIATTECCKLLLTSKNPDSLSKPFFLYGSFIYKKQIYTRFRETIRYLSQNECCFTEIYGSNLSCISDAKTLLNLLSLLF